MLYHIISYCGLFEVAAEGIEQLWLLGLCSLDLAGGVMANSASPFVGVVSVQCPLSSFAQDT